MCSANIGEDRLSTFVLVHFGLPPRILLNPWALFPCIWCCSWTHICAAFSFPFKFRFFWAPLARAVLRRRGSSLVVFGNGRTHTGEVDGSGGSRLANYCLRAPTKRGARGEAANRWAAGELFSGTFGSMSEWLMVPRGGVNLFPPSHPSLKTPVTLWFAGFGWQISMCDTTEDGFELRNMNKKINPH